MRKFSFLSIIWLCIALLIVDVLTFYWLQAITKPIEIPFFRPIVYTAFWVFTFGLITSIITLRATLNSIHPKRKQLFISSLYGLTVTSFFPKIIFVIIISVLYFSNTFFTEEVSLIVIPLIGVFSGVLPFFVILYGIFLAVYRFKVYTVKLKFEWLPKKFNHLKIVHISDLHLGSFNYRYQILERAVNMINDLNPDFIFFTGDLVNNYAWELKGWDTVFNKLNATKGKFAVLGNHDYGDYSTWETASLKEANFKAILKFYQKINFKVLLNEADIYEEENEKIAILGIENWGVPPFKQYGDLKKTLTITKGVSFKILLSHDPTHWSEEVVGKENIALTLSGHTHGMQAGIQFKNKKWSPIKYKYKHWAGLYKFNNQYLYVNRGLGWLGFPGRLGMRPEITLIKLEN